MAASQMNEQHSPRCGWIRLPHDTAHRPEAVTA
jgi:hypothetical protein